jgi:hypothetical protein
VDAFLKEESTGFSEEVAAVCEGRRGVTYDYSKVPSPATEVAIN